MTSKSLQLQDDERFALMKFRRSVADVLQPHHDDHFLVRWLRARSWNPEAAEEMLRKSMEWRKKWEVDTVIKKTWKPPEVLLKYYPGSQVGFDKEGAPVIIVPFAGLDLYGILHTVSKQDVIKYTCLLLETYLDKSIETGAHKVSVIMDMEKFSLRQYAWRPAGELIISLLQMYEANYPETLKECYIINAPSVFALAFTVVKKFLNEYTIGKMQIFKAEPRKWQPVLRDRMVVDQLPKHFGGELVDPDGDPRCPSVVKQGGKVPKSLWCKNQTENPEELKSAVIRKGKQLALDFIVAEDGCALRWDFRTEDHDIRFGITCRDGDGVETTELPLHRVNSHRVNEVGIMPCKHPATYTVVFDNTYSFLRSKRLLYNIRLTLPIDKLDISTYPTDENDDGDAEVIDPEPQTDALRTQPPA